MGAGAPPAFMFMFMLFIYVLFKKFSYILIIKNFNNKTVDNLRFHNCSDCSVNFAFLNDAKIF